MDDLTPLIQMLGGKLPQVAVYWLAAEKILKLIQPAITSRIHGAIARAVESGQDSEDEEMLRRIFASKAYRVTAFGLDFLIRLKLPGVADLERALKAKASTPIAPVILAAGLLALTGCARFTTTQTDMSYEDGQPARQITTKATAWTFGTAKSSLAQFKATQTDKTQGASVGALAQESSATNAVSLFEKGIEAAVRGAAKAAVPTP